MSPGATKEDCEETLCYLRELKLGLPESLLHELAFNYIFESPFELDASAFSEVLNRPGGKLVLAGYSADGFGAEAASLSLLDEAISKGVDFNVAIGALLIIKTSRDVYIQMVRDRSIYRLENHINKSLHSDSLHGVAMYLDEAQGNGVSLTLILAGILPEQTTPATL